MKQPLNFEESKETKKTNNWVIFELLQRIPSHPLPQGSGPTQFCGLLLQDSVREFRPESAAIQFSYINNWDPPNVVKKMSKRN